MKGPSQTIATVQIVRGLVIDPGASNKRPEKAKRKTDGSKRSPHIAIIVHPKNLTMSNH
tara:strand:- start:211 stop:387 length:177 start_codon:yes stop_codon:yes gene_type:complete